MDSESERQLLERVTALEAQVERLNQGVKIPDTPEVTSNKLIDAIERIDPSSLTRVLREIPKDHWARTFFGLPRKTMEKLKSSVSKNSWRELVEDWTASHYRLGRQLDHEQLLRVLSQLEEMGEIVMDSPTVPNPEAFDEALRIPFDAEAHRARWAEEDRKAAAETERWMAVELAGMI